MPRDPFTINKAAVRDLDLRLIKRHLKYDKGNLRYFGLPGRNLIELQAWNPFFGHFSAVERGKASNGFLEQHNLLLSAMQLALSEKLILLRGEMDEILLHGKDEFNTTIPYPFDVVSLDYSGGIIYKESRGKSRRSDAIGQLLYQQAAFDKDFMLFISSNLDNEDQGEIKRVLTDINREFGKIGIDANETINSIIHHKSEEARLKIYLPFVINRLADRWYKCEFNKSVFYLGNRDTRMMHFSFWLKRTSKYSVGKPSPSDLVDIVNLPALFVRNGKKTEIDFGIPKINL
jgi:hypothetical protein